MLVDKYKRERYPLKWVSEDTNTFINVQGISVPEAVLIKFAENLNLEQTHILPYITNGIHVPAKPKNGSVLPEHQFDRQCLPKEATHPSEISDA